MSYLIICSVALVASGLTFFSGFGLGTVLLPAFALFFAIEKAIALTAVVHFLNGLFKLILVWRHIDRAIVIRFGGFAILGALAGAWCLLWLSGAQTLLTYSLFGRNIDIAPIKLVVGILLLIFACAELLPSLSKIAVPNRWLPVGGMLSGFFGGLSGMQGALRSAFLVNAGLSKEAFVATGAAIAFLIDVSRLGMYARQLSEHQGDLEYTLLGAAILAAFAGAAIGNRYLTKVTMKGIQSTVAIFLLAVALGLITGVL